MYLLVATHITQGQRRNDFCHAKDDEIVKRGVVCKKDEGLPDGKCGCARSLVGVSSGKGTTTVRTAIIDNLSFSQFCELLMKSEIDAKLIGEKPTLEELENIGHHARWLEDAADKYEPGTVLEYRDGEFTVREQL